jgi:ribosomal protein L11 methyltransferase
VEDLLWFLGATAIAEVDAGPHVALEAGFPTEDDADAAAVEVVARFPGVAATVVDAGPALDAALDAWKAHARPVRAGRLHVRPPWLAPDDDPPADDEVVVVVDPGRAFGSGSHPTTLACLAAVDERAGPGASVLDVGCGSGVLAVAAARLGAGPVVAVDVDPTAVAATLDNAARNDVEIDASTSAVGDLPAGERFDLVLANIGAATLRSIAPDLSDRVAPGGHLVLSGLLAAQADGVVAAFPCGTEVGRTTGEWSTITLTIRENPANTE